MNENRSSDKYDDRPEVRDSDVSAEPDAVDRDASSDNDESSRSLVREVVETLLIALIIFVAVRAVVLNFRVDGLSMMPNLQNGEMLLVNRNAYASFDTWTLVDWIPGIDHDDPNTVHPFSPPQRGDVVVLNAPVDGADKPYIKRIIGLPGETIELRDDSVFINGQQLDEPYLDEVTECGSQRYCGPLTIPEDAVFVMGDNRDDSEDSPDFGPVETDRLVGKAWFTYWPWNEIGVVPHYDYPGFD